MIFSFIRVETCKLSEGHVNRIERLILQLRHRNGSLTNSYKGMADPLITESEVRCAQDYLNSHKGAGPDRLFSKVLKALSSHIARMFKLPLQTVQFPKDWHSTIVI